VHRVLTDGPSAPYHVVFLDPPYADPVDDDLVMLVAHRWLADGAVVVVERSTRSPVPSWPDGMVPDRSRRYGDTVLHYGLWYGRRP
jgi:16S rRNA (guanine966-N2)-methyltransferase